MTITVLCAKVQRAEVTNSNVFRNHGGLTLDEDIMDELGVLTHQECRVNSIDGFWGVTYLLAGKRGSGCCEANGALAAHILKGDVIHINVFCLMSKEAAKNYKPVVVWSNKI